jgi:hypothetical protein
MDLCLGASPKPGGLSGRDAQRHDAILQLSFSLLLMLKTVFSTKKG